MCKKIKSDIYLIFYTKIYIKGLITRIYREFKKLNSPKLNELIKK
jgi:hypothetical protein